MNSRSTAPSSGKAGVSRKAVTRSGGFPGMSQRQAEAYLLARDAVRRIQRTASLISAASQWAGVGSRRAQGNLHQSH